AGGGKKAGLIVGAVAVVAALGVGAYVVLGAGGGADSVADDGAHKLTAPETVLDGEYTILSDSGTGDSDATEDFASGVENGTSVVGVYSTMDLDSYDPSDPAALSTDFSTLMLIGVYGEIDDPEAALDNFFAKAQTSSAQDSSGSGTTTVELVGEPESVDIDGALMKCQEATGLNPVS
ncbi:hypothetical protein NGM37_07425, partial [Streptomyces sp. TRM76130]|nr:hypothetical protein [Streptomyces sp. TRM76130]